MAAVASERVLQWEGKDWPPAAAATAKTNFRVEGIVQNSFPLKVRRAGFQQGYLAAQNTAETSLQVHAIVVKVTAVSNADTKDKLTVAQFKAAIEGFLQQANGGKASESTIIGDDVFVLWANRQIPAELRSRKDATLEPLSPETVLALTTDSASLLVKDVRVTKAGPLAKDVKRKPVDIDNAFSNFSQGYAALQKPQQKPADDDWED